VTEEANFFKKVAFLLFLGVTQLEFLHLKNEPQRSQSSRKDRKVLKYIFA